MNKINIETAQNVYIEYEVASLAIRYIAAFIDFTIGIAYFMVASFLLSLFVWEFDNWSSWFMLFVSLPFLFYHLFFEVFFQGQSIGKRVMRIKVVKVDGTQVTMGDYLTRWVFRMVETLPSLGGIAILAILFNGKGQRLGDMAAGTTVVSVNNRVYLGEVIFRGREKDYEITYPEVRNFNDHDIAIIRDVLIDAIKVKNKKVVIELANKVARELGVEVERSPVRFLQRVLKDYNYMHV